MKLEKNQKLLLKDLSNCIRILTADAVEVAKSGHPGMPLGIADVMTVLVFKFLKFNPNQPRWFARDRLVLSAGHGAMLLYAFYYLAGFRDFSLNDLKTFRNLGSKAAGHPERNIYEAIETTTGPLGQGFATSVGMAIAQKKYQTRLGKEISDYKIYAIVGDGCLMEGIAYEAASLAGHLKLNNLVVIFDDNGMSIDGSTSLTISEDHLNKFKAFGFEVESIDGYNLDQINDSMHRATSSTKPYFIACKTLLGKGLNLKAGNKKSHGAPVGKDEIEYLKNNISFENKSFQIKQKLLDTWRDSSKKSMGLFKKWQQYFEKLNYNDKKYLEGFQQIDYSSLHPEELLTSNKMQATRISSGKILQKIINCNDKVIAGSADLSISSSVFGTTSKAITAQDFSGNFIHYGARENAMAAIMNGLALSGFLPVAGTFFVFSDYMRPSIRLASMMKTKVIYLMTHDSIGVGEDGPTHQPIEHLASFRAMPNIKVFRPADFIETLECYIDALNYDGPSMLVLSRQDLKQVRVEYTLQNNFCRYGAYIISEAKDNSNIDVVIFTSGSEVSIAIGVKEIIEISYNKSVRVVSVPCFENLENMGLSYIKRFTSKVKHRVAIEAGSAFGWHKLIGIDGTFFGVDAFGFSASKNILYDYFGLTITKIVKTMINKIL